MHDPLAKSLQAVRSLAAAGRYDDALAEMERIVAAHPGRAAAHTARADILTAAARPAAAEAAYRCALALDPGHAPAMFGLAELLAAGGGNDEALTLVEAGVRQAPADARGPRLLGRMYLERGLHVQAIHCLEAAARLEPDHPDTIANLGLAQQTAGHLDAAKRCYESALRLAAGHSGALRGLARIAEVTGRPAEVIDRLEPAACADDTDAELAAVYARLLGQVGRADEALALLRAKLETANRDHDRMVLSFELGALLDRAGRYEDAMTAIMEANRLKGAVFDPDNYRTLVGRLIQSFTAERLAACPRSSLADDRPVLIVGMPRSGTSLVEQMLASHPQVSGAGELAELGLLALASAGSGLEYPESALTQGQDDLDSLSRIYLRRIDQLAAGARRVTDKMWQNFEFLGMAELLLPGARVIECVRDPMDTGLSCYFQHFFGQGVPFSYDLAHIGAYYRQYRRTMDHWHRVLTLPIHTISYERLCADPEPAVRSLLEFLELPWDASCLRFYETDRAVQTASYGQVRQPIYQSSIGRHRRYERWLGPLAAALRDPSGPAAGAGSAGTD